jgi:capsular polysaccharide biosynthesis protein
VLDGPDIAVSQLSKSHYQEIVDAGEVLDFVVASVRGDVTAKSAQRRNAMS